MRKQKKYGGKYDNYKAIKNYCIWNFKKQYKKSFIFRRKVKRKRKKYLKFIKAFTFHKKLKLAHRRTIWKKKQKIKKKLLWWIINKNNDGRSFIRRYRVYIRGKEFRRDLEKRKFVKKIKIKVRRKLFISFKKKRKLYLKKFVTRKYTIIRRNRIKIKTLKRFRTKIKFAKKPNTNIKSSHSEIQSEFLLIIQQFKELYNFQYILSRLSSEIDIEELNLERYVKEYSQINLRWRFTERRSQKKYLPWLQVLIANKNLYRFQSYNMLRREKPMYVTKKNKIYKKFLMSTHHRFRKIKLKPRKRGGNRYIALQTNLLKSFLPYFNGISKKDIKNIWNKHLRIKSKYITRDMKFWNQLNLNYHSSAQLLNWSPTTPWSDLAVKKGWINSTTLHNIQPQWNLKYNFPLLMNVCSKTNNKLLINNKNLITNSFKVLKQSDIIHINPYIKKYFLSFLNRKTRWNKKPIFTLAFDRNANYNSAIINLFTREFPLGFKNRNIKTNMKYLKVI